MGTERIRVLNGNWGGTSLVAVHAVLGSVYDVLAQAFEKEPETPINVAWWNQPPRVFFDRRPYEVRISSRDTYWCQYVYQFSHELCHILTNFDRQQTHTHKWFEEALCESASLFVLNRLTDAWMARPPETVFGATQYAPHFSTYARDVLRDHSQPAQHALPRWLDQHIERLEAHPHHREINRTVATTLLERFLDDPSLWRECGELNGWNASTNASFREYLQAWSAHLVSLGREPRLPEVLSLVFDRQR